MPESGRVEPAQQLRAPNVAAGDAAELPDEVFLHAVHAE
jgi:hypothetical protein